MENIIPNKQYKPMEIVKLGIIKSTAGTSGYSAYNFVLRLIKRKKLKATNVGTGKIPHFLVSGTELKRYLNS
jgi:hypothetical protein